MLRRIMLPVDESEFSEQAVPLAQLLARAQGAVLQLVRVIEPLWTPLSTIEGGVSPTLYESLLEAVETDTRNGLRRVANNLRALGVEVEPAALHGTAAACLLAFEEDARPDLVVMATHGRGGLARFALGSVADRIVREGSVPVLLVRPSGIAPHALQRALVPLDGSPLAETALSMVEALARRPLHSVALFQVVAAKDDFGAASGYLDEVAARLKPSGLVVDTRVEVGDPSTAIRDAAPGAHVVIMSTHGRGGYDRLRHGSVAEQAARQVETPVLLVRAA
jgi:nucleotide-binding universal stress UspA family protein